MPQRLQRAEAHTCRLGQTRAGEVAVPRSALDVVVHAGASQAMQACWIQAPVSGMWLAGCSCGVLLVTCKLVFLAVLEADHCEKAVVTDVGPHSCPVRLF